MRLHLFWCMPPAANDADGGDGKRKYWQQYVYWPGPVY